MAIGTVISAPVNTTSYTAQRPATTDTTPTNLGDRFTPSSGNDAGIYSMKDVRAAVSAQTKPSVAVQQSLFVSDMKQAGIKDVQNPPTPEQLKAYFATFNNPKDREKALGKAQAYAEAFHVHTAEANGDKDVKYSDETNFVVGDKVYKNADDMKKATKNQGEFVEVKTADASSWKDVQKRPTSEDGRRIQDCEGFAFMQQELLQAAGYKTQQVATLGDAGYAHAMVLATDPDSGQQAVASNSEVFTNKYGGEAALNQAWNRATEWKNQGHGDFFYGATQAEAQARLGASL